MAVETAENSVSWLGERNAEVDDYMRVAMPGDYNAAVDIDPSRLYGLTAADLQILATRAGVTQARAKTSREIIAELTWIIENNELYQQVAHN